MQKANKSLTFEDVVDPLYILKKYSTEKHLATRWNSIQLQAAVRLIYHFFGEDWYEIAFASPLDEKRTSTRARRRFEKLFKEKQHPLAQAYWSKTPEGLARVIGLGSALKVLGFNSGDTNLSIKIQELQSHSFLRAYFELKMAATYALSGFFIKFLQPSDGSKSPDLAVSINEESTYIECKKREPISQAGLYTRTFSILDRLRDANSQISSVSNHGVVCLEVEDNLKNEGREIQSYVKAIQEELPLLPRVSCVLLSWEILKKTQSVTHLTTAARGIPNRHTPNKNPVPVECLCNPNYLIGNMPPIIPLGDGPSGFIKVVFELDKGD